MTTPTAPAWRVPYVDLRREFTRRKAAYLARIEEVCADARFILRHEVDEIEAWCAAYLGVKWCVGVGSGADALLLATHALGIGPGDEVITVGHGFVATVAAVGLRGATPVLVDIRDDFNMDPAALARAITPRTKLVIPVHMNGRCCDMARIREICDPRGIPTVEDAAQAIGASVDGIRAGAHGVVGCFSFHPMKVLHCFGDGGLVCTSDDAIAENLRLLRNHGQRTKTDIACFGYNSRLDTLQAAVLLENAKLLDGWIRRKREVAARFDEAFRGVGDLVLPPSPTADARFHDVYTSYVVRTPRREALKAALTEVNIEVFVHGAPPVHQHPALGFKGVSLSRNEKIAAEMLSLPIFPEIEDDQVDYVIDHVCQFFRS